jgi:UBX domain-containing protein 1/4
VPVQSGVNATMLASLMEMGFPRPRAVRALHATFSRSAEAAMEWCFEHADDTGVDDPLTPLEDVVAGPAAAAASGSGRGGGSGSQLTPAERQAKAAALLEKARERRAAEEKAAEIEREKARVREGKELVAAKAKLEEQQRKRVIEERRREKREQLEERQRIRERIAADKAARAERFRKSSGDAVAPAAAPAAAPVVPKTALLPTAAGGKIQFRLPDGSRLEGTFAADATLAQAAGFVAHERPDVAAAGFQLISQYPKRVFTEADMLTSLADAQLLPRGALTVTPL